MKFCTGIIAAAALCVTPALAADMHVKAPVAPPVVYGWNGFYIGGNVGAVTESASGTSDFLDPSAILTPPDSLSNPQANSFSNTGAIGGFQLGYNWQFDRTWVAGVEGDFDLTHTSYSACRQTNTNGPPCSNAGGDGFESIGSTTHWLSTLRGRIGVSVDSFLLYGTGGVAFGSIDTNLSLICPTGCGSSSVVLTTSASPNTIATGWVAGLGGEMRITGNWSARLEWLHIDLGNVNGTLTTAGLSGPVLPQVPSSQTAVWSRTEQYDTVRFGVNYQLR